MCATTQKIVRVILAPGQRNDCVLAEALPGPVEGVAVIADKAFDTDAIRNDLAARGCTAVIPSKANRRHPKKLNKALYRWRHGIDIDQAWRLSRTNGWVGSAGNEAFWVEHQSRPNPRGRSTSDSWSTRSRHSSTASRRSASVLSARLSGRLSRHC